MRKKQYYLILDTETTNGLAYPLAYDIGFTIIDRQGRVYEKKSYVVQEIFDNSDLMDTAYYKEKMPLYNTDIEKKLAYKKRLLTIRQDIETILNKYNIKEMYAYNCGFDKRALKNTTARINCDRFYGFFFRKIDYNCIWHMACKVLCKSRNYKKFCTDNDYISEKGNYKTSAEIVYRYLTKDTNFNEQHRGLADSNIESKILQAIWKRHKKVDKSINSACWRMI